MREFTTAFIAAKNALEQGAPWAALIELTINANTTAYFTSHPETLTWNNQIYAPVPMQIGTEDLKSDGSLPSYVVDVSNYKGQTFKFAKDNDLSMNDCWIRLINTAIVTSGSDARMRLQIEGMAFNSEAARFNLGLPITTEVFGPKRTYDRYLFKLPTGFKNYALIASPR